MADLRISDLPELTSGQVAADDPLAITDLSASTTKKVKASVLVLDAILGLPAASIPATQINLGALAAGSVGTIQLANDAVTAAKLDDQSATGISASLPANGGFIGQLHVLTGAVPRVYSWTGSAWLDVSGIVSVDGSTTGLVNTYAVTTSNGVTVTSDIDDTTAAGQFLAGPASAAGAISARTITSTDLPTAGASKGAVVVSGNGLGMTGDTLGLSAGASVVPTGRLVQYDSNGLVVSGAVISPIDLPISATGSVGAVQPGSGLSVDGTGTLAIDNAVVAGTFPKITFNTEGLVTAGAILDVTDIPDLGASKITSGTFPTARLDENVITKSKLADYSIAYIQEAQPNIADPVNHIGILWYQESTAQLRIYNGNSFNSVGFGRLSQENLRWGGIINANTGLLTGVTEVGTTAGLVIGQALPTASDSLGGIYVLVGVAGSNISVASGIAFDSGDWCLCVNATDGWVKIDNVGGGGGGGATNLGQLLDVTITNAQTGDLLQLQSNGQWQNISAIDGGTF